MSLLSSEVGAGGNIRFSTNWMDKSSYKHLLPLLHHICLNRNVPIASLASLNSSSYVAWGLTSQSLTISRSRVQILCGPPPIVCPRARGLEVLDAPLGI